MKKTRRLFPRCFIKAKQISHYATRKAIGSRKVRPSGRHKARAGAAEAEKQLQWSEPMWNRLISPNEIHASPWTAAGIDINLPPCTDAILPSLETVRMQIRAGGFHCRSRGDRDVPDNARAIARNRVNEFHGESRVGLGRFLEYLHACHNLLNQIARREHGVKCSPRSSLMRKRETREDREILMEIMDECFRLLS